tara:strand:- start:363 stop:689 length:327 start_codon:yes stop_codon:yes gene_type:complete
LNYVASALTVAILAASTGVAVASTVVETNLYWPEVQGPHCDSYESAIEQLEDNIVALATERCADHGHHAPSIEHVHYHLHKVTSEWQHYQRAIARDVQVQCPMTASGQ